MPMNQGATISLVPGLTLKARSFTTGAGALLKSLNIATYTRTSAGVYAVVFTTAMGSANYLMDVKLRNGSGGLGRVLAFVVSSITASGLTINTFSTDGTTPLDVPVQLEIYE